MREVISIVIRCTESPEHLFTNHITMTVYVSVHALPGFSRANVWEEIKSHLFAANGVNRDAAGHVQWTVLGVLFH